jgi:hypothetical protein
VGALTYFRLHLAFDVFERDVRLPDLAFRGVVAWAGAAEADEAGEAADSELLDDEPECLVFELFVGHAVEFFHRDHGFLRCSQSTGLITTGAE